MQQGASLNSWLQWVYWPHVLLSLQARPFVQFPYRS